MTWDIDATPDDLTIRSGLLPKPRPPRRLSDTAIGLGVWALVFGWLFALGWVIGGLPLP